MKIWCKTHEIEKMSNTSPTQYGKVQMISMVSSFFSYKTYVVLPIVKASKSIVSEIENKISILKRKDSMLLPVQPIVTHSLVVSLRAANLYHIRYVSIVNRYPPRTKFCIPMH
jgi:reverse gyrase